MVACLKAVAAATEAVLATIDTVAMCLLSVHVPHGVKSFIYRKKNAHLTSARLLHWKNVLLTMTHVTLKKCTVL